MLQVEQCHMKGNWDCIFSGSVLTVNSWLSRPARVSFMCFRTIPSKHFMLVGVRTTGEIIVEAGDSWFLWLWHNDGGTQELKWAAGTGWKCPGTCLPAGQHILESGLTPCLVLQLVVLIFIRVELTWCSCRVKYSDIYKNLMFRCFAVFPLLTLFKPLSNALLRWVLMNMSLTWWVLSISTVFIFKPKWIKTAELIN